MGRTPRSAADALVGLVAISIHFEQRDQGVPRGPGGPPHNGSPLGSDLRDGPPQPDYADAYPTIFENPRDTEGGGSQGQHPAASRAKAGAQSTADRRRVDHGTQAGAERKLEQRKGRQNDGQDARPGTETQQANARDGTRR